MESYSIKAVKALQLKKNRLSAGCFVVEGKKSVEELLKSDLEIEVLFHTSELAQAPFAAVGKITDAKTMQRMSAMKQAPGVLAVVKTPKATGFPSVEKPLLILDDIADPGNLGTIIRLADWFDCQLGFTIDCCESYNPKVVQASMGSLFRLKEYRYSKPQWIEWADKNQLEIAIADMGGASLGSAKLPPLIVIGNEARGVSESFRMAAKRCIGIDRNGNAESLNAATAAAIFLYEIAKN